MKSLCVLLAVLAAFLMIRDSTVAAEPDDVYRVTDQVLVRDPARFAMNVEFSAYAPWDVDRKLNAWNRMATCEPLQFQHNGTADGGGDDFLENSSAPRLSYWDCVRSGFWDGADVRIYRVENDRLALVRKAKVARSVMGNDANGKPTEERLYFTDKGPAVKSGDFYVLTMERDSQPAQMRENVLPKGGAPYDGLVSRQGNVQWSIDRSTFAPEGGSTASMKMVCRDGTTQRPAALWQWFMVTNSTDARFFPDKRYRLQIWLRQEGVTSGVVRVQVGTITNIDFAVGKEWKKFETDLDVANPQFAYRSFQGDATRLLVGIAGSGTVWIDNFLIWQTDAPPFAALPEYVRQLKEFHPQTLRLWSGYDAPSLDAWLKSGFAQPSRGGIKGTFSPAMPSLDVLLNLCRETGAEPWLILNPFFTDEEIAGLMEYLGGPADKGYGAIRAKQGQAEPWTKVFHTIRLECGNEAWNQMFGPRAWPGNPGLYARVADRFFAEAKKSPWFNRANFELIANGWDSSLGVGGWTHRLAQESHEADRLDMAMYFGGWEKGADNTGGNDAIYQDKLLATPIEYGPKMVDTLLLDPDLFRRLCAALAHQPDLASAALADFQPRHKAATVAPQLEAILGDSEARRAAVVKSFRGMREVIEKPAWDLGRLVLGTNPKFLPRAAAALGVSDEAAGKIVLITSNVGSAPGALTELMTKQPEIADGLLKSLPFTGAETQTVRGVAAGKRLDYSVVNKVVKRVADTVADLTLEPGGDFVRAMSEQLTAQNVRSGAELAGYVSGGTLSEMCGDVSDSVLQAMKDSPDFAKSACDVFATKPDIFQTTARSLAASSADGIANAFATPFEVVPWGQKFLMFEKLPRDVSLKIARSSLEIADSPSSSLPSEARLILRALYSMSAGDAAPARALSADPGLSRAIEEKMRTSILSVFLAAAKRDGRIGDRLLRAIAQTPRSPGAKGLSVYEAGPGYSLPGPGKKASEDDENIGKSLVSGTATLDVFMLAASQGIAPISYYNFKSGQYWATHKHPLDPVPYPTWLALQMRNRYATGDLLSVEPVAMQATDIPDKKVIATTNDGKGDEKTIRGRKGVAWTACYAFRDGRRYSLLIINRDLHHPRSVKLELPFTPSPHATRYALTNSDPRANNRETYQVRISEEKIENFSADKITVPPASVYLIVTESR